MVGVAALAAELGAAYIHFQRSWDKGLAIHWLVERLTEHLGGGPESARRRATVTATDTLHAYNQRFAVLADTLALRAIPLIVLYVPQFPAAMPERRRFFLDLCAERRLSCVDLTTDFQAYPADWLYQVPSDNHLSVLGHRLVAAALLRALREPDMQQALARGRPQGEALRLRGPNPPGVDEVRVYSGLAYRVVTNSSGFRMAQDIDRGSGRLVLVLGDSFTFGTTVDTEFAYPTLVARQLAGVTMLNAGIPGAGIAQESELFLRMQGTQALSLTVLQVLDNDLDQEDLPR